MSRRRPAAPAASLIAVGLMLAWVSPAPATGPNFASRALPALLTIDETNLTRLPAGLRFFDPRVVIQAGRGSTGINLGYTGPFGLVAAGSGARYAYVYDNGAHAALLSAGRFGFSLAYYEQLGTRESALFQYRGNGQDDEYFRHTADTNNLREVRGGLGWFAETASGRLFEAGAGASWLQVTHTSLSEDIEGNLYALGWDDRGVGRGDILVRTLHPERGVQFAAGYVYEEPNADHGETLLPTKDRSQSASLDVAWRQPVQRLDDLVVGGSGRWSDVEVSGVDAGSNSGVQRQTITKTLYVNLFASVEKEVVPNLEVRGGVLGGLTHYDSETAEVAYPLESDIVEYSVSAARNKAWTVDSPTIRLGLGWTWKGLVADVLLDQELDLSNLIASWAVTFPL